MRPILAALVLVTLAFTACGDDDGDGGGTDTPNPTPSVTEPPSPTATPVVFGTVVQYESAGSGTITAAYLAPEGQTGVPAVVLLHEEGAGRDQWAEFAPALAAAGYAVLAPDFDYANDPETLSTDVSASLDYLDTQPAVDPARHAIIGSSLGANVAYVASGTIPDLTTVITLSVDSRPQDPAMVGDGISVFSPRSVLFIADEAESPESTALANRVTDPVEVKILSGQAAHGGRAAHGIELLDEEIVTTGIMDWLALRFAEPASLSPGS
jgi:dienelactone hydrolase